MNELYLTDAYGTKWIFYISPANCLCYTRSGTKDEILTRNITNEFDIVLDENGHFHILCESLDGTLMYIRYNYTEWKKYEILKNKSGIPKISGIKLFMADKTPTAFYVLEHNGQKLLAEHKIRAGISTSPMIIDVLGKSGMFFALFDCEKCFHLFYKNELGKTLYKRAPYGARSFSGADFPSEHDIVKITAASGEDNTIHVAYIANINSYHTVCYYNMQTQTLKSLAFGVAPRSVPTISADDGKIRIRWCDNLRSFECVSANGGEAFSKHANIQKGAKLFRMLDGSFSKLCISDAPALSVRPDKHPLQNRDNIKSSVQRELKEKLQKTETELTKMRELYDSLNTKLDYLTSKMEDASKAPVQKKPDKKETYSFSEIKARFEASDEDMTEMFNKLDFDDVNFKGAFAGTPQSLPIIKPSAPLPDENTKNDDNKV